MIPEPDTPRWSVGEAAEFMGHIVLIVDITDTGMLIEFERGSRINCTGETIIRLLRKLDHARP